MRVNIDAPYDPPLRRVVTGELTGTLQLRFTPIKPNLRRPPAVAFSVLED